VISGADLNQAIKLFRLIACFTPRALMLAELTRSAFGSLPTALRPTLLIAQAELPRRVVSLCCAANYRGAVIPWKGGAVLDIAGPKAFFVGMDGTQWNDPCVQVSLVPTPSGLPPLDDGAQRRVADYILPQLLKYRFDHLRKVRESYSVSSQGKTPTTELARCLTACIPDGPELQQSVASILEAEESDLRERKLHDVDSIIVEVLWAKIAGPIGEIGVAQFADRVNAVLLSRGSRLAYTPEEIGWRLRKLGIPRGDNRDGRIVRFSRETAIRVHRLARALGLNLPKHPDTCADCAQPQPLDE
jgi:hypothetical protein